MINSKSLRLIELACRKNFPKETCGFIDESGNFIEVENTSPNPETKFEIDIVTFAEHRETAIALFHSHTQTRLGLHICTPSMEDALLWKRYKFPMLIAGFDGTIYTPAVEFPSKISLELFNRPHIYGINTCATLIRDYMFKNFQILIDFDPVVQLQNSRYWVNQVEDILKKHDFRKLSKDVKLRQHDIIVTSSAGGLGNHGGVCYSPHELLAQEAFSGIYPMEDYLSSIHSVYRRVSL